MSGIAFRDLKPNMPYFPTIGMKKPGETLRANFGQEPFAFDIDKMVQDEKAAIHHEINQTKFVANASTAPDETQCIHRLISQYLAHDGYVETAQAFAEEIVDEARSLANGDDASIPYQEAVEDMDALNRQSACDDTSSFINADLIQKSEQPSSKATLTRLSNTHKHTTHQYCETTTTSTSNCAAGNSSR